MDYPGARKSKSTNEFYRRLEDHDSKTFKDCVERHVALTESLLKAGELSKRITTLHDHSRYDCPFNFSNKYCDFPNTGLQDKSTLYNQDMLEAEAQVLCDANTLRKVALSISEVSENVEFLTASLTNSGSDWVNTKVIRMAGKSMEHDILSWVKFSSLLGLGATQSSLTATIQAPRKEIGQTREQKQMSILIINYFTISGAPINLKMFATGKIQNIPSGQLTLMTQMTESMNVVTL